MPTNEQRIERLRSAPEYIQQMYGSFETAEILGKVRGRYNIDPDSEFVTIVGDVILGFYTKRELPLLLQQHAFSPNVIEQITSDLETFLEKVPASSHASPELSTEENLSKPTIAPERAEVPHAHTMSGDTKILRKEGDGPDRSSLPSDPVHAPASKENLTPIPRYAKPLTDTPRYGDENTTKESP